MFARERRMRVSERGVQSVAWEDCNEVRNDGVAGGATHTSPMSTQ